MKRRPLIAGNWKMYLTLDEAVHLARAVASTCGQCTDRDVMIAPPFTALAAVATAMKGLSLQVGAQNVAWEKEGAYTGEISPIMLKDLGVDMAIIGHSERRRIFGEDNIMINRRLCAALDAGITPILCIGETLEEREAGATLAVLERQLREGMTNVHQQQAARVVLAYEPVWAIGTGRTASPQQAQEVHALIRARFARDSADVAAGLRILYGGSVKANNAAELFGQADIDGGLIGGASLVAADFLAICAAA